MRTAFVKGLVFVFAASAVAFMAVAPSFVAGQQNQPSKQQQDAEKDKQKKGCCG